MSVDDSKREYWQKAQEAREQADKQSAADPLKGGGGDDGMDAWQNSVEKRLDSLDRRLTSIESDASSIKADLATVKANVSHLPSKGFTVTTTIAALTVLSLIVGLLTNMDKLTSAPNASSASRTEAVGNSN